MPQGGQILADIEQLAKQDPAREEQWRAEAMANPPSLEDWVNLVVKLRRAAELDKCWYMLPDTPPGLIPAEYALRAVMDFLINQRDLKELGTGPLARLLADIGDLLFDGHIAPMLRPSNRRRGNPGKGEGAAMVQGKAAQAFTELVEGGMPRIEAAKEVAAALRDASKRGLGKVTAQTVINWQARLSQGPGPGAPELAVQAYRDPVADLGDNPLERGKILVAALRERAAAFVG